MPKKLVYDLPTRIFHWVFAAFFVITFFIAKTVDDDDPAFSYHMLAGLMLGGLVVLRLIWGVVGSKYARFSSFALKPTDLISYFKGIVSGSKKSWTGHNPASSWAALIMLGSALMLGLTGYLMSTGFKERFEDLHELFANLFLVTVLLHIAGVFIHSLRHGDAIAHSMLHGKKVDQTQDPAILNHKPIAALLLVVLLISYAGYLYKNYDFQKQELSFLGKTLQLGENEKEDDD